jgi:hypothetical protein
MMPRVRFVDAGDGTSIAFSTLGAGPPLVLMPAILFSHLEKMWEVPQVREGLERLGEGWTVVRYDELAALREHDLDPVLEPARRRFDQARGGRRESRCAGVDADPPAGLPRSV